MFESLKSLRCRSCGRIIADYGDIVDGTVRIICKRNMIKNNDGKLVRCNTVNVLTVKGGVEKIYTVPQNM